MYAAGVIKMPKETRLITFISELTGQLTYQKVRSVAGGPKKEKSKPEAQLIVAKEKRRKYKRDPLPKSDASRRNSKRIKKTNS
jgi:hypothetical protein